MNILVTGGAGFIGSNFVRYWKKNYPNDLIVVFDKFTYAGNMDNIHDLPIEVIKGDICDKFYFELAVKDYHIDTIIHFAAESHVDRSIDAPDDFIQTNIVGTFQILEVLKSHPEIRFHHISTDEVYGDLPIDKPEIKFNEHSKYEPSSPYSASKASSDHLVHAYIKTYRINATISNCSNNFGPYCYPEKLIPLIITRALNDEELPVYGTGLQVRDWIHTEDHAKGIDLILKNGKIGETYLLGGNGERTNLFVIKKILEILEKPERLIVHVGERKGHDQRYAIDYSKAETELGFKPAKSFEERLEETIAWYVENEDWWKEGKKTADIIAQKYLAKKV